jgi:hypothetical protein
LMEEGQKKDVLMLDLAWEQHGQIHGRIVVGQGKPGESNPQGNRYAKAKEEDKRRPAIALVTGILNNLRPRLTVCSEDEAARDEAVSAGLDAVKWSEAATYAGARPHSVGPSFDNPLPEVSAPENPWPGPPLVVRLGTDPSATLSAIWAHQPSCVHMLVDESTPELALLITRFQELARYHPECLRTAIRFHTTLDDALASVNDVAAVVNVSPGTKRQKSEIALRTTLPLWSLHRDNDRNTVQVRHLEDGTERETKQPAPLLAHAYVSGGIRYKNSKPQEGSDATQWDEKKLAFHRALGLRLCEWLQTVEREKCQTYKGRPEDFGLGDLRLTCLAQAVRNNSIRNITATDNACFLVTCEDDRRIERAVRLNSPTEGLGGEWFEDVAAACVVLAAQKRQRSIEARVGVQSSRSTRPQDTRTDGDVVAGVGHNLFLFDAKAGRSPSGNVQRTDTAVKARMLGRFCFPVAVRPWINEYDRNTFKAPEWGAAMFDLRTLVQTDSLLKKLEDLVRTRRIAPGDFTRERAEDES